MYMCLYVYIFWKENKEIAQKKISVLYILQLSYLPTLLAVFMQIMYA